MPVKRFTPARVIVRKIFDDGCGSRTYAVLLHESGQKIGEVFRDRSGWAWSDVNGRRYKTGYANLDRRADALYEVVAKWVYGVSF